MKAQEVREQLRGKVDVSVIKVIEVICEDIHELRQKLMIVARGLDSMSSLMETIFQINTEMQSAVKQLQRTDSVVSSEEVLEHKDGKDAKR